MNPLRCLLVDDERLARNNLRALLTAHPEVAIVGEAADLPRAEEAVLKFKPDLVFLDIQLGGRDGFQLLERLHMLPKIIFVTAYDRYAVRAFEVNALDYLLKPVDPDRLKQALARVAPEPPAEKRPVPAKAVGMEDAMLIPAGRSGYFIRVRDILLIRAEGNYSSILTENGRTHTVLSTLADWEQRLPNPGFLRVGRNLILNLGQIRKIEPFGRHAFVELGSGGVRLELRRAAAERLKQAIAK